MRRGYSTYTTRTFDKQVRPDALVVGREQDERGAGILPLY